ncbi:MAG: flagellar basal body rod protein FlgB [Alphaproteobacteria bacterium]|nr:flagellar basal body rod protein FlgB [Alphaproteobacteria bacterium]
MDSKSVPILSALRTRMEWLSERQKLLSENIANADTPGFRARDLKPVDFHKLLKSQSTSELALTHPMHIKGGTGAQNFKFKPQESDIFEVNPSGNTVSIEEQMVKLGETQMEYETATGIYRKQSQMLKIALGNRN